MVLSFVKAQLIQLWKSERQINTHSVGLFRIQATGARKCAMFVMNYGSRKKS